MYLQWKLKLRTICFDGWRRGHLWWSMTPMEFVGRGMIGGRNGQRGWCREQGWGAGALSFITLSSLCRRRASNSMPTALSVAEKNLKFYKHSHPNKVHPIFLCIQLWQSKTYLEPQPTIWQRTNTHHNDEKGIKYTPYLMPILCGRSKTYLKMYQTTAEILQIANNWPLRPRNIISLSPSTFHVVQCIQLCDINYSLNSINITYWPHQEL